jgi:upstream activation factor subunit UAF30
MATAKKSVKKAAPAKKAPAKKAAGKGLSAKVTPSADLAAIIGSSPMPRTEVTKQVWNYIRKHDLQDKKNRRNINADDKLKVIFGGKKQVTMFELTSLVSKHLKA